MNFPRKSRRAGGSDCHRVGIQLDRNAYLRDKNRPSGGEEGEGSDLPPTGTFDGHGGGGVRMPEFVKVDHKQ